MYCRKCGAKLIEDSQFCAKCGTKVEDPDAVLGAAQSEDQPPAETADEAEGPASAAEEASHPLMFPLQDLEATPGSPPETSPGPAANPSPPASASTDQESSAQAQDGGLELAPSLLPSPDGIRSVTQQQIDADKELRRQEKKRKKTKKRWHPLDTYKPLKEKFRFGGCGLFIFLVIVVPIAAVGAIGWIQYNTFVDQKGFESVVQKKPNVIEASDSDTLYWGLNVLYEAEETDAEVAFVGTTWWLNGTFREKVYFRGFRLVLEEGARFEKGLDVQAAVFSPGSAEIVGDLTGNIVTQQ